MKTSLTSIALFLCFSLHAQDAREIVQKADNKARGRSSQIEMTITTVRPKWTRSMDIKVWSKGTELAMILVQAPKKDEGVAYLKRKKEVWNWLPTLERTVKLPPSMMSQSWMGTDFTNDDLVKESSVVDDYTQKLLGSETVDGRDCYKIELTPKPGAAVVWEKVLEWIDKKDYIVMRTEFYEEGGGLVNSMQASDIKQFGDRMMPSKVEMIPVKKSGQKTVITYKSMIFDKPIDDGFFSTENMKKVK